MARLKPWDAGRWVYCAASVPMQEQHPRTEKSETRQEGIATHYVAEQVLLNTQCSHLQRLPLCFDFVGETAPNGVLIDESMCDAADQYVMDVLKVCQADGLLQQIRVEQLIQIPRIHATENEGVPDCWVFNAQTRVLDIWDLKNGFGIVEPFENWPMMDYAIGIIDSLGHDDMHITVNLRIVQPRAHHPDGTIRVWTIKGTDLRTYANLLQYQGALALSDNPPAKSGKHCKNCSAYFACQTADHAAMNAIDVGGAMAVEVIPADQLKLHRSVLLRATDAIKYRLNAVDAQIIAMIGNDQPVAGLALDNPPGSLKWTRPDAEIKVLGEMMGAVLTKEKPITPTQALALRSPDKTKLIDEAVIKAYATRSKGKTKIVDSTTTQASKVFGNKKVN